MTCASLLNVATLTGHTQEVCGLKWSPEGHQLASGGNENLLCIWDDAASGTRAGAPQLPKFSCSEHQAAVKALAWTPHERNLIASGGGTNDRCIKFTNSMTGACLNSIDTESQVCSLLWNPYEKEILSSNGFFPQRALPVEVPVHVQGQRAHGPHGASAAHGHVAFRWPSGQCRRR